MSRGSRPRGPWKTADLWARAQRPFLRLRGGRAVEIDVRDAYRRRRRCPLLIAVGYRRLIAQVDAGGLLAGSTPLTDVSDVRVYRMVRHRGIVDVIPTL
jgi:hypothetical protein